MPFDIRLTDDGDLPPSGQFVSDTDMYIQALKIRLAQGLGEWALDLTQGLPFDRWIESNVPPLDEARLLYFEEISSADGVQRVENFKVQYNSRSRAVEVTADIYFVSGDAVRLGVTTGTQPGDAQAFAVSYIRHIPGTSFIGP